MAGNQRRDAKRVRYGHADKTGVKRWRMDNHPIVLEQRIQTLAIGGHRRQECRERVLVHDHQVQEEHLNGGDDSDDIWNQLSMSLTVYVNRDRRKNREQEDPEHDRTVQSAPVGRDLVEERLDAVRVMRNVLD